MKIVLQINKTVEQNAAHYFAIAKKAKKKMAGSQKAIEKFEAELAKQAQKNALLEASETSIDSTNTSKISLDPKKPHKAVWFEKFRWFITSTGFLVIGGRDAQSNEAIIKKHTSSNDIVFHTDMAGSPFFVVKADSNLSHPELLHDEKTLREVADATCSFSRAWKRGMSTVAVFYVTPDQVTKQANSGEFLATGSFVIKGKTNYIDNQINLACGIFSNKAYSDYVGLFMSGPKETIQAHCQEYSLLKQGESKPSDVAKELKKKYKISNLDLIIRTLPSENIAIEKERQRTIRK